MRVEGFGCFRCIFPTLKASALETSESYVMTCLGEIYVFFLFKVGVDFKNFPESVGAMHPVFY